MITQIISKAGKVNYAKLGIIILALVILYFSYTRISNWIKTNKNIEPLPGASEGPEKPTSNNFNPEIIANELFDVLNGIFDSASYKEAAAKRFFELTRVAKIRVWNYWNLNFATKMNDETIYGAMLSEANRPSAFVNPSANIKSYYQRTIEFFEQDPTLNYKKLK